MKFTGMHLHLILVAAVICVVLYVFYISRDIVLIDKEVKALHDRLDMLMKTPPRPVQAASAGPANLKPTPTTSSMAGAPYPRPQPPAVAPLAKLAPSPLSTAPPSKQAPPVARMTPSPVPQQARVSFISDDDDDDDDEETEDIVSEESDDIQAHVVKLEVDDDEDEDDESKLKKMLDAVVNDTQNPPAPPASPASPASPAPPAPTTSFDNLSWSDIKDRCKKLNIAIRGSTKDQLLAKLKDAST